ncbi:MAG: transglutaminase family protein [Oceanococcaceae bacterium]
MSLRFQLRHYTEYRYEEFVESAHNQLRMHLREVPGQVIERRTVRMHPAPDWTRLQSDYFGNRVLWVQTSREHRASKIFVKHDVRVSARRLHPAEQTATVAELRACLDSDRYAQDPELAMLRLPSRLVPVDEELAAFAAPYLVADRPVLAAAEALQAHIFGTFTFSPLATSISTPVHEVLESRKGVCQDFAHLMVAGLRSCGLAARYVSGYIETLPPPGKPRLVGADASHAWVSVWCGPEVGWQDLDPTNNQRPQGQHLTTAWGRDYDDVIPLNGVIFGGGESSTLKVRVDLRRLPSAIKNSALDGPALDIGK